MRERLQATQNALLAWTSRWSPAEQRIIVIAIVSIIVLLFWALLWIPAANERAAIEAQLPRLRADLARMQVQAEEVRQLRSLPAQAAAVRSPGPANAPALRAIFGEAAVITTQGPQGWRVTMASGTWPALLDSLSRAQQAHELRVTELQVNAQTTPADKSASGRVLVWEMLLQVLDTKPR